MLEQGSLGFHQRKFPRPGPGPHRLILDGEGVPDRIVRHPGEALNHAKVVAGPLERILPIEIRGGDDQRVSLPAAPREPDPLPDLVWRLRTSVQRDHPSVVDHLGENHHVPRALHDVIVAVVARVHHRRSGAAHDQAAIVELIGLCGVPSPAEPFALCLAFGRSSFSFCGQRRNLPVGWIEDQRRPQAPCPAGARPRRRRSRSRARAPRASDPWSSPPRRGAGRAARRTRPSRW